MGCGNLVAFCFTGGSVMSRPIFILTLLRLLAAGACGRPSNLQRAPGVPAHLRQGAGLAVAGGGILSPHVAGDG